MPSSASAASQLCTLSLHDALPIYAQIGAVIEEMRREGVAQRMRRQVLFDAGGTRIALDDVPEGLPRHALAATSRKQIIGLTLEQDRSEEHTSELQSLRHLVCRLLLRRRLSSALFPYTTLFRSTRRSAP